MKSVPQMYNGFGFNRQEYEAAMKEVLGAGMPAINPAELQHINELHYDTLRELYPAREMVVKSFPGLMTETTEKEPLHYDNAAPIADAVRSFDYVLTHGKQPWGIMLAHASYNLDGFPGLGSKKPIEVPDMLTNMVRKGLNLPNSASVKDVFSQVPASLNPVVTQYLRDEKGYKGVLVGDWYNMGAIEDFQDKMRGPLSSLANIKDDSSKPGRYDPALFMAVMSGVNYIRPQLANPGIMNERFWTDFAKNAPDAYKVFNDKLNNTILSTYNTLKTSSDPVKTIDDINRLPLKDRFELISSSALGGTQREWAQNEADFSQVKASFPDKALFESHQRQKSCYRERCLGSHWYSDNDASQTHHGAFVEQKIPKRSYRWQG